MIGHELTALYHLDHAQTLAVILPALLAERRDSKRAKLLQYAERVWQQHEGSEELRIDNALAATREFFERMGVATRLSAYQLDGGVIPKVLEQLKQHKLTSLGEHRDIDLEVSARILLRAL